MPRRSAEAMSMEAPRLWPTIGIGHAREFELALERVADK
jgi:hypothetical protein